MGSPLPWVQEKISGFAKFKNEKLHPVQAVPLVSIGMQRQQGHGLESRYDVGNMPCTYTDVRLGAAAMSVQPLHPN